MDQDVTRQKARWRGGGVEGQDRGRLGQTMGVGRNVGKERMQVVDKMHAEGNSQEVKTGNLEGLNTNF